MAGEPITAVAIETDENFTYEDEDGTVYEHPDSTFTPDNMARFREGRACLRCWELQEIPFLIAASDVIRRTKEKHLPGCAYTYDGIQNHQQRDFAEEFSGEKWIGPKRRLEETIAEDDERRRKYEVDTGYKAGPWVPPWVKL